MRPIAMAAAALLTSAAAANAQDATTAKATFIGAEGDEIGTAELTSTAAGVLIAIEVQGLPAGQWVAFHVHETGTCDHESGHESAGGHFNPESKEHGFLSEGGPHAGDMPNQYVGGDGILRADVLNTFVSLGDGEDGITGRALMIHAGPDDNESQPSGDAGDRLACAVIQ